MKLNAVGVSSSNFKESIRFYSILGFNFPEIKDDEQHVEALETSPIRFMLDSKELVESLIGEAPRPGNHSAFAIEYNTPEELNQIVEKLRIQKYIIKKEPWDAFWGQRYAVVQDPDGYL